MPLSELAPAGPGQLAYPWTRHGDVATRYAAQPGGIGFGRLVVRAGDQLVRLPSAPSDLVAGAELGFVLRPEHYPPFIHGSYPDGEVLPLLLAGYVWVEIEAAVSSGGPVFIRTAPGAGGTKLGIARGDDDSGTATALPARFHVVSGGQAFAVVRLGGGS